MIDSVEFFGTSMKGPLHRAQRLANQDAWIGRRGSFGSLIVVCDGVGTKPHSSKGARMACLAAVDAVRKWSRACNAPTAYLAHLIEVLWRIRISPLEPRDCATTCLLALRRDNGTWVVGGVGDGIAVTQSGQDEMQWVIGSTRQGFSNETEAMGFERTIKPWRFRTFDEDRNSRVVLLATDGISDDLIQERATEFISWLISMHSMGAKTPQSNVLRRQLCNWPTKNHTDDKTLAVLFNNAAAHRKTE